MMYGRKSEIQRIQAKLQRMGQANPYRSNLNEGPRHEQPRQEHPKHELPRNELPRNELPRNELPRNELPGHELTRNEGAVDEVSGNEISKNEISKNEMRTVESRTDQLKKIEQSSNSSVTHNGSGKSLQQPLTEVQPFISTHDRYHTPAGQQALKEMGEVAKLPDPLPEAVTFSPQSPWANSPWNCSPWPSQISLVDREASKNSHQLAYSLRQQRYTSDSGGYERGYTSPAADSTQLDWNKDAHGSSSSPHGGVGDWLPEHIASWGTHSRFSLAQGLMWLIGAVVIRMGIDRLLGAFPSLWVVMAAMVLTPVAIALYQTAVNPQATVHSGRRLLVIMMGLLIGGQL